MRAASACVGAFVCLGFAARASYGQAPCNAVIHCPPPVPVHTQPLPPPPTVCTRPPPPVSVHTHPLPPPPTVCTRPLPPMPMIDFHCPRQAPLHPCQRAHGD